MSTDFVLVCMSYRSSILFWFVVELVADFFYVDDRNLLTKMDSYIFFIDVQNVFKTIEMIINEIQSDDCTSVFFTKGNLLIQNQISNRIKCYISNSIVSVFSVFQIENDDELDVQLFTPKKSSIAPAQLKQFLMQYKSCSHFHIEVVFPQGAITGLSHKVNVLSFFML